MWKLIRHILIEFVLVSEVFVCFFLDLLLTVEGLPGRASSQSAARPQSGTGASVLKTKTMKSDDN